MGYVSKDIGIISEPKIVTLSGSTNFVQFASYPHEIVYYEASIQINVLPTTPPSIPLKTLLTITEPSGAVHSFSGTTDLTEVGGSTYYVSSDKSDTAENLRIALLSNRWIDANFDIRIPSTWSGGAVSNGLVIDIKSKGAGSEFNITIDAPNNTAGVAYTIVIIAGTSLLGDSISHEETTAEIDLDIYESPDVFLGTDDRPLTTAKLGTYSITLQKTYAGVPLWFELNGLFSQYGAYTNPPGVYGWFDTGTSKVFRFIAKVRALNSYAFYQSNALFVINGYGLASEMLDLTPYIYHDNSIKLLTNKPRTTYIKGQKEFLNFLLKDPFHGLDGNPEYTLKVAYQVYSASDAYLGIVYAHDIIRSSLNFTNTCALDIDSILTTYPLAGIVRVALSRDNIIVSNYQEYTIRPECFHKLYQFTFLNRLGGWDTFNFDNYAMDEVKPTFLTYDKTLTPAHAKGKSIETVYSSSLANTLTVEGAPVTDAVATWLKELAAARVVLDGYGNYVIKEDFNLQVSEKTQNFQVPTIKFRLSETYTND